jgi:hypothetical protein
MIEIFGLPRPVPPRLWAHRSVSAGKLQNPLYAPPGHCQTKFYTTCLGTETRSSLTVFAMNRHRGGQDSRPKMAYTCLP